jgi:DNA-binding CsgD family transcriptional regulator
VGGFEITVSGNGRGPQLTSVTILRLPSVRPDLFMVVHLLQPIAEDSRLARLLARHGAVPAEHPAVPALAAMGAPVEAPPLTARECEILHLVASGLQNKEVAQKLDLSLATVRNHVHNILDKLAVHSKLEAVSLAFRRGWVRAPIEPAAPAGAPPPAVTGRAR